MCIRDRLSSATNATILCKNLVKIGPVVTAENWLIEIALHVDVVVRRISPDILDRFSQSFHHMKELYMLMTEQYYILPFVKGLCHGNQLKSKNRPISFVTLPFWNRLQYHNSDFKILVVFDILAEKGLYQTHRVYYNLIILVSVVDLTAASFYHLQTFQRLVLWCFEEVTEC